MLSATMGRTAVAAAMTVGSEEKNPGSWERPRKMAPAVAMPTLTPICSRRRR